MQINGKNFKLRKIQKNSRILRRSDGTCTIGLCDSRNGIIYIADGLTDEQFHKCLIHEICHAAMFAYNIELSVEQEEIVCQIMAEYGIEIIAIAEQIFQRMKRRSTS